ncbi:85/ calcium-independent phospholipase A2 [Araneus ventricosus]|uniref:phospholipase A2 n=1 Tax=Araneus ventricosus TaxID=182803 RepID=A0A4Y2LMV5_ARAVE|nr:85/ calcium-independent phospholipase A2 [Araneus ventricosus]
MTNVRNFPIYFRGSDDPNAVLEVNHHFYNASDFIIKEHPLFLYKKGHDLFEILIEIGNSLFSLRRNNSERTSKLWLIEFNAVLPRLIHSSPRIGSSTSALTQICTLILENRSWNVAHIAACGGFAECFGDEVISCQINSRCPLSYKTPLHVAVESSQLNSVKELMSLDAEINCQDADGNTPFHLAATTTKEIIQALSRKTAPTVINMFNNKGFTAFHLACIANRTDCVMQFLKAGVDVNLTESNCSGVHSPSRSMKEIVNAHRNRFSKNDIKYGGTPLHWSQAPELTELLVEHGCNINAKNFQGDTALHLMVMHKRLSCTMMLLRHQADTDIQNSEGNTPLHLAVKNGNSALVQTLIAFGSNINLLNNNHESARHLAATDSELAIGEIFYGLHVIGANRCLFPLESCNEGCTANGNFNGIQPENGAFSKSLHEEDQSSGFDFKVEEEINKHIPSCVFGDSSKNVKILCLDGGGIRGLVLIQMLEELENVLGGRISNHFDFIAGTSTGGILALLIASGKTMKDCRCLYFRLKDQVFAGQRPYRAELLEAFLQKELGESTVMEDIEKPKLIITATRADVKPAALHVFRNYESPLDILNSMERDHLTNAVPSHTRNKLWEVARATGAAPTCFCPMGSLIDGGFVANNPTVVAITEILELNHIFKKTKQLDKVRKIQLVLSMGTGRPPVVPDDVYHPTSFWNVGAVAAGLNNLVQLLVNQATRTDGDIVQTSKALCNTIGCPFLRLTPQLSEDVSLDEKNEETIIKMLCETRIYINSKKREFEYLKKILSSY